MYAPDVIFHIIDPTKDSVTTSPLTRDVRSMLRFVSVADFPAREPALGGGKVPLVAAEQRFRLSSKVLAQIAPPGEDRLRATPWIGTFPSHSVIERIAKIVEIGRIARR